jgi:hypothetical protein
VEDATPPSSIEGSHMIGHVALSLVLSGAAIGILVKGLRFRPSTPVWNLFVIFFMVIWAGGVWAAPVGPSHLGIFWLPFVLIAILLAVLVVALAPRGSRSHRDELAVEREVEAELGLFFWILIGALMVLIVARYR